ncbi:MAG: glycosyltransferase [Pyrinomonadaceae bacterium]
MRFSEQKRIKLSIVVAAWNGAAMLCDCLSSLENQIESINTEIIVVSNFENGIDKLSAEFSFANYIVLPPETTIPKLRARGIIESSGAIIALSEDICAFDNNWCREIVKAHDSEYSIIGGAIENSENQNALDWAVYFYDYGKYMLPDKAQIIDALSGMNVSYKREILEQIKENYADGFFETFINEDLKRRGDKLFFTPLAIVFHRKNYEFEKVAAQFYHQARSFAARRVSNFSTSKKLLFILAAPLLPILLCARVMGRIIAKGQHFKELLTALPQLVILISIWSFGEFCGYLSGEGKSGDEWK